MASADGKTLYAVEPATQGIALIDLGSGQIHTSLRQSLAVSCSSPPVKEGGAAQDVRLALQGVTAGSQGVFE